MCDTLPLVFSKWDKKGSLFEGIMVRVSMFDGFGK